MEITVFYSAKNTEPDNSEGLDWSAFCDFMLDLTNDTYHRNNKLDCPAFIFGRCVGKRNKANIQFLSGLAADFDIGPDDPRYLRFDDVCDMLEARGFQYIAYTTTKSEADHHKFRIVMPYAHDIRVELCQSAWHKCNSDIFNGAIDPSTKDESRLSFLPATWEGDVFHDRGNLIHIETPYAAFRCSKAGFPVLSATDIAALKPTASKMQSKPWQGSTTVLPILSATQMQKLAHGNKPDAPCWALLADLNHSPLVTRWMRDELPAIEGNRDYRFMLYAACNAVVKNIPVDVDTLLVLADRFSTDKLNRQLPHDAMRQAQNALAWAFHNSPK